MMAIYSHFRFVAHSDNSVLTTNNFLASFRDAYILEGEWVIELSIVAQVQHDTISTTLESDQMWRWLNFWLFKTPIESYPDDIVAQNGKHVME
jgi:hypothetical protein